MQDYEESVMLKYENRENIIYFLTKKTTVTHYKKFLQKDEDGNWALAEYTSGLGLGDLGNVKPTDLERATVDRLSDMGVNSSVLAGSIDIASQNQE